MVTEAQVWNALDRVNDPEFPINIVDLGMVYGVSVDRNDVAIKMTFTSIGCPAIDMIIEDMQQSVGEIPGVKKTDIEVTWNPPWTKEMISVRGRQILQCHGVGI